ncbi:MAG: Uma2 family endonuclease [Caldilineaceae bacterium SB0661_bin_32]|uniref:Uma2 family endonuclease n=1 Tax=Caldilineaceae bacterium SB0661_bin_32 TaxID=2605255 RepID=A0A6B1D3H1_9CHLR|nr:Uma2 family endonuclease [Caldilineaceae bacterium]MXZ20222.1 Uma2 family endonuclease [Caldilineaceae bacterium SB0665_bin_25]MYC94361.1 Uma2 family endonuclease [Caldilineaceae bacterium SB0661_bin_32]
MAASVTPKSNLLEDYEKERGKPMPSFNHGVVQANLVVALNAACRDRFLIASELSLASEPPMTPDISICSLRQPDWLHDEIRVAEAPLTTVEIVSPSQSINDFVPRIEDYFRFGVRSVWLVLPPLKQVAVFAPETEPEVFSEGNVVDPSLEAIVALDEIFS